MGAACPFVFFSFHFFFGFDITTQRTGTLGNDLPCVSCRGFFFPSWLDAYGWLRRGCYLPLRRFCRSEAFGFGFFQRSDFLVLWVVLRTGRVKESGVEQSRAENGSFVLVFCFCFFFLSCFGLGLGFGVSHPVSGSGFWLAFSRNQRFGCHGWMRSGRREEKRRERRGRPDGD